MLNDEKLIIEIVKGGFILSYPRFVGGEHVETMREIFVSPRKLHQKLKDIISEVGLVDKGVKEDVEG